MSASLDILFLGRLFPRKNEETVRKKSYKDMQDAANVLQWNLIDGFVENGCDSVTVQSFLPLDSWPKHSDSPFIKPFEYRENESVNFCSSGFCNVTYIKQLLCRNVCTKALLKWAKNRKEGRKKVIVCYTCNNTLMRAVAAVKKKYPDVVAVQVIADITEFAANGQLGFFRRLHLKSQIKANEVYKSAINGYVLLTEQMKDKLALTKPYIVMEGIAPIREALNQGESVGENIVLYTGSMNRKYGILHLLEAFSKIPYEDYRLVLCGLGNAEPEIRDYASKDSRIRFLGKVPHGEVLKLQRTAKVLVNPRQNNEEFTKYSFPSKNLEYLSSGIPVAAYKLDGIPDEYDEYINYPSDDSAQALADEIVKLCRLPFEEWQEMGDRAREFVLDNKTKTTQTKRILELINNLL